MIIYHEVHMLQLSILELISLNYSLYNRYTNIID